MTDGVPHVVAIGGGRGLATVLRAVRRYAGTITAVVSVADDGGSSGRLRRDLGLPAVGDLRKALSALAADESALGAALEYRFAAGDLSGHALGNLLIAGLVEAGHDLLAALDETARAVGAVGRVLPASLDAVTLVADVADGTVSGQVAVARAATSTEVRHVRIEPAGARPCPEAVDALGSADQVVLAPGSLYTSVVAVLCVPAVGRAVAATRARVVQVANLRPDAETPSLDGAGHLRAVLAHGARVDTFLYDPAAGLPVDADEVRCLGATPVAAPVQAGGLEEGPAHDPAQLARALQALL